MFSRQKVLIYIGDCINIMQLLPICYHVYDTGIILLLLRNFAGIR